MGVGVGESEHWQLIYIRSVSSSLSPYSVKGAIYSYGTLKVLWIWCYELAYGIHLKQDSVDQEHWVHIFLYSTRVRNMDPTDPLLLPAEEVAIEIFYDFGDGLGSDLVTGHNLMKHQLLEASSSRLWSCWPPSIHLRRSCIDQQSYCTAVEFSAYDQGSNDDVWKVVNDLLQILQAVGNEGCFAFVLTITTSPSGEVVTKLGTEPVVSDFLSPWIWVCDEENAPANQQDVLQDGVAYIHRGHVRILAGKEDTLLNGDGDKHTPLMARYKRPLLQYREQTVQEKKAEERIRFRIRGIVKMPGETDEDVLRVLPQASHVHCAVWVSKTVARLIRAWPQLPTLALLAFLEQGSSAGAVGRRGKETYIPGPKLADYIADAKTLLNFRLSGRKGSTSTATKTTIMLPHHLVLRNLRMPALQRMPEAFLLRSWVPERKSDHAARLLGCRVSYGLELLFSNFLGLDRLSEVCPENVLPSLAYSKTAAFNLDRLRNNFVIHEEILNGTRQIEQPGVPPSFFKSPIVYRLMTNQWPAEKLEMLKTLDRLRQLAESFREVKAYVTGSDVTTAPDELEDHQPFNSGLWMMLLRGLHDSGDYEDDEEQDESGDESLNCSAEACTGFWNEDERESNDDESLYKSMLKVVAGGDASGKELQRVLGETPWDTQETANLLRNGLERQSNLLDGLDFGREEKPEDLTQLIKEMRDMGLDVDSDDESSEQPNEEVSGDDDSDDDDGKESDKFGNWLRELIAMNDDELSRTLEGYSSSFAGGAVTDSSAASSLAGGPGAFLLQELRRATENSSSKRTKNDQLSSAAP